MDYPLAEAILGFAGGSRLDMAVVRSHQEYATNIRAARRAGIRPAAGRAAGGLRTGGHRRPAEPPRLPRHAADAHGPRRRPRGRPAGDAPPGDPARGALHLLRRRGRAGRRQRPRLSPGLPMGPGCVGPRPADVRPRASSRLARATRRCGPDRVDVVAAAGGAVAYRARRRRPAARSSSSTPATTRRDSSCGSTSPTAPASSPLDLPGAVRCGRGVIGRRLVAVAVVELGPRSGSVLSVG